MEEGGVKSFQFGVFGRGHCSRKRQEEESWVSFEAREQGDEIELEEKGEPDELSCHIEPRIT